MEQFMTKWEEFQIHQMQYKIGLHLMDGEYSLNKLMEGVDTL